MPGYAELAQEQLDSINPVAKHVSEIRRIAAAAKEFMANVGQEVRRIRKVRATIAERRQPRR